jgi:hypothetical protein
VGYRAAQHVVGRWLRQILEGFEMMNYIFSMVLLITLVATPAAADVEVFGSSLGLKRKFI